jgi:protein TonB
MRGLGAGLFWGSVALALHLAVLWVAPLGGGGGGRAGAGGTATVTLAATGPDIAALADSWSVAPAAPATAPARIDRPASPAVSPSLVPRVRPAIRSATRRPAGPAIGGDGASARPAARRRATGTDAGRGARCGARTHPASGGNRCRADASPAGRPGAGRPGHGGCRCRPGPPGGRRGQPAPAGAAGDARHRGARAPDPVAPTRAAGLGGGAVAQTGGAGPPEPTEGQRRSLLATWGGAIRARVARALRRPAGARASGEVWLTLTVDRQGALLAVWVSGPSGNAALDRAALDAVRRAGRFPPAPAALDGASHVFDLPVR